MTNKEAELRCVIADLKSICTELISALKREIDYAYKVGTRMNSCIEENNALKIQMAETADRIEQLEKALARCRNAMPIPDGGELEQLWSEAVSDVYAVPAYVKASVAKLKESK